MATGVCQGSGVGWADHRDDLPVGRARHDALSTLGHPFFRPRWRPGIIGMVLDAGVDWDEVAELVTESYCLLAPQKLCRSRQERPDGTSTPAGGQDDQHDHAERDAVDHERHEAARADRA